MPERIKCPSCGAGLILSQSGGDWRATCPRCLAEIAIPEATAAPNAIQAERPERREGASSCPRCGRAVEAVWVTCPWCDEPLRQRHTPFGRADLDVRRDATRTSVLVYLFAVIGVLGVGGTAWTILEDSNGGFQGLFALAVPLLFFAGISTLIVFLRSRGNPGVAGFRRVAVGTFALAGGVTLTIAIAFAALIAFFFVVCSQMFR